MGLFYINNHLKKNSFPLIKKKKCIKNHDKCLSKVL